MKTKLLKKHPLKQIGDLFVVKYDLALIGYKTKEEAQEKRFEYLKKRYASKTK